MERFAVMGTCQRCQGSGELRHPRAGEVLDCFRCGGTKARRKRDYGYGQSYKTAATAARALADGRGEPCRYCDGTGKAAPLPMTERCYTCDGSGEDVTACEPGDTLPGTWSLTRNMSKAVAQHLAGALAVVIVPQDRSGTWNEAHLGAGTVYSVTDYGRRWDAMRANPDTAARELEAAVRESLSKGEQWCKLAPSETRRVPLAVYVSLHRGGYSVMAEGSASQSYSLPPAYTSELLNRPTTG